MQCALWSVQCAVCCMQNAVCSIQFAVCSMQCAVSVCSVQCTVYSVQYECTLLLTPWQHVLSEQAARLQEVHLSINLSSGRILLNKLLPIISFSWYYIFLGILYCNFVVNLKFLEQNCISSFLIMQQSKRAPLTIIA